MFAECLARGAVLVMAKPERITRFRFGSRAVIVTASQYGGVAEWFKAPVLKTGDAQASGSSNLPPSAIQFRGVSVCSHRKG